MFSSSEKVLLLYRCSADEKTQKEPRITRTFTHKEAMDLLPNDAARAQVQQWLDKYAHIEKRIPLNSHNDEPHHSTPTP